jgi:hypothetical protein
MSRGVRTVPGGLSIGCEDRVEFLVGRGGRDLGPAGGFEGLALGLEGLDGLQEGGALDDFLAVIGIGRRGGSELGLVAAQAGGEAAQA